MFDSIRIALGTALYLVGLIETPMLLFSKGDAIWVRSLWVSCTALVAGFGLLPAPRWPLARGLMLLAAAAGLLREGALDLLGSHLALAGIMLAYLGVGLGSLRVAPLYSASVTIRQGENAWRVAFRRPPAFQASRLTVERDGIQVMRGPGPQDERFFGGLHRVEVSFDRVARVRWRWWHRDLTLFLHTQAGLIDAFAVEPLPRGQSSEREARALYVALRQRVQQHRAGRAEATAANQRAG